MSTGMADCSEYRDLVQLVIDGEASPQEVTYLRRHLKMCLKCLDRYNIDNEIKQMLKLKLAKIEVPAGLAETIRSKLIQ